MNKHKFLIELFTQEPYLRTDSKIMGSNGIGQSKTTSSSEMR